MSAGQPVVMRVLPEYRTGRGVYWRPDGWGYTDWLDEAGRFEPPGPRSDYAEPVPVSIALRTDDDQERAR